MEVKLNTENTKKFYEDLLAKIREIRKSERSPEAKIQEIICLASDNDNEDSNAPKAEIFSLLSKYNYAGQVRLANYIVYVAESCAQNNNTPTIDFLSYITKKELNSIMNNQGIYDFPSFMADYETDEDGNPEYALLPKELKGFKGRSMVLKIEDMDRLIDTFCDCDTYYRRAYAILADLDQRVLDGVEEGIFDEWILIPYKEGGDAMFQFSHFEVDLREPDENYRTLYVVYRYDTTCS